MNVIDNSHMEQIVGFVATLPHGEFTVVHHDRGENKYWVVRVLDSDKREQNNPFYARANSFSAALKKLSEIIYALSP